MVWEASRQARFPFLDEVAITAVQGRRLQETVAYTRAHVPYYRETLRRLLLGPEDFCNVADLCRLPLLERDQLRRDPDFFRSDRWPADSCVLLQSGGTTGEPLTIFRDPPSLLLEAAHRERQRSLVARLAGRRLAPYREAAISPHDSSVSTARDALRRTSLLPPGIRVRRRTFSMLRPPAELLPELDRYRPRVITSYGSYLEALLSCAIKRGSPLSSARVAVYGADSFSPTIRDDARSRLGIEVLGSYNAVETPQVGFECEHHRGYHLNVDLCPVRVIGPDGRDVGTGETGELVVSNLVNRGTVLLNYRLGDVVARIEGACQCRRTLPLCSYPERKGTRWLDLGDGVRIHSQALQLILRTEMGVWRYQIVQEQRRSFLLRIVPSADGDRETMSRRILARFGEVEPAIATRLEFVSELPRTAGAKVEPVVGL